jgi:hypothetical protein
LYIVRLCIYATAVELSGVVTSVTFLVLQSPGSMAKDSSMACLMQTCQPTMLDMTACSGHIWVPDSVTYLQLDRCDIKTLIAPGVQSLKMSSCSTGNDAPTMDLPSLFCLEVETSEEMDPPLRVQMNQLIGVHLNLYSRDDVSFISNTTNEVAAVYTLTVEPQVEGQDLSCDEATHMGYCPTLRADKFILRIGCKHEDVRSALGGRVDGDNPALVELCHNRKRTDDDVHVVSTEPGYQLRSSWSGHENPNWWCDECEEP